MKNQLLDALGYQHIYSHTCSPRATVKGNKGTIFLVPPEAALVNFSCATKPARANIGSGCMLVAVKSTRARAVVLVSDPDESLSVQIPIARGNLSTLLPAES